MANKNLLWVVDGVANLYLGIDMVELSTKSWKG